MGPKDALKIWIEPDGTISGKDVPEGYSLKDNKIKFNRELTGWFVEKEEHIYGPEFGRLPWMKEAYVL